MLLRYANLYGWFFIQRLKILLEYRVNFLIGAISTLIEQGAKLGALWVVMSQVPTLQGWSFSEVLLIYGLATISRSVEHMFADNLWTVGAFYIRQGDFDRFLVRPVNPLFHLLADRFNQDGIGEFVIGLVLIVGSSLQLGIEWTVLNVLYAIVAVIAGGTIFIALNLLTASSSFWIVDSRPITRSVFELHEFAKYPLSMYAKGVMLALTWLVPYGFASFYPASYLLGRDTGGLEWVSPIVAAVLSGIAYRAWTVGLRHYQGTGS